MEDKLNSVDESKSLFSIEFAINNNLPLSFITTEKANISSSIRESVEREYGIFGSCIICEKLIEKIKALMKDDQFKEGKKAKVNASIVRTITEDFRKNYFFISEGVEMEYKYTMILESSIYRLLTPESSLAQRKQFLDSLLKDHLVLFESEENQNTFLNSLEKEKTRENIIDFRDKAQQRLKKHTREIWRSFPAMKEDSILYHVEETLSILDPVANTSHEKDNLMLILKNLPRFLTSYKLVQNKRLKAVEAEDLPLIKVLTKNLSATDNMV